MLWSAAARVPLLALLAWACALSALAQPARPVTPAESPGFLTRFNYHLSLEGFVPGDSQFRGDADFGGDFDIVGGPRWRLNAQFNYEAILGDELQPFDPNQGNYLIEVSGGPRRGRFEGALVFHHTSRHLGDRFKDFGIAWNLLGAQGTWTRRADGVTSQVQVRVLGAVMADAVDYSGELSASALHAQRVGGRLSLVGRGSVLARTIDESVSSRATQVGARGEAALRVDGRSAVLEFFAGVERRVDASAFVARPESWALVGVRLMNPD